jgi:hypothetical protein
MDPPLSTEANVSYSLLLLTAGWMASQTASVPSAPGGTPCSGTTAQAVYASSNEEAGPAMHPGFLARLRSMFHSSEQPVVYTPAWTPPVPPVMTTAEPPQAGVENTAYKPPVGEVQKKYQDRIGNAEDYRWLTGQLFYLHTAEGGVWVVRYSAVDQVDRYGGSVALAPGLDMKNYREGDLVSVEGEILAGRKAPGHLGCALYRATSISMITRADR